MYPTRWRSSIYRDRHFRRNVGRYDSMLTGDTCWYLGLLWSERTWTIAMFKFFHQECETKDRVSSESSKRQTKDYDQSNAEISIRNVTLEYPSSIVAVEKGVAESLEDVTSGEHSQVIGHPRWSRYAEKGSLVPKSRPENFSDTLPSVTPRLFSVTSLFRLCESAWITATINSQWLCWATKTYYLQRRDKWPVGKFVWYSA